MQLYITKVFIPIYLFFLVASLFLSIFSYRKLSGEMRRSWIISFILLRTLLFFFVFSALFSLILELRFSRREKPFVYVLLDSSQSMDIKKDGISRKEMAAAYIKENILPPLSKKAETHIFLFSDKIYDPVDSLSINKGATMLGDVLKNISGMKQRHPSAVILCSDGRNTSGNDPVGVAERLPFPVYTIKIGESAEENNISISGLRVNPIVYKEDSVPVSVILSNLGKERKKVTIEIKRNGKILDSKEVPILESGIDYPVQLTFIPRKPGFENLNVSVKKFDDESNKDDNRRNFTVKVLKKRKSVVLIGYKLTWDYRFIRAFLLDRDDIESVCFAKISKDLYAIQFKNEESKGNLNRETVLNADMIILINPKTISPDLLRSIKKNIEGKGLGLLIIGNEIPNFAEFTSIYPFVSSGSTYTGDFEPNITHLGLSSPVFMGADLSASKLPPVSNPLRITSVKPLTEVYLEGIKENIKTPLFAGINYGKGKIAAFTGENLWHWKMLSFAAHYDPMIYDEILNNIIHWITIRKEEERIVFRAEKNRYLWGEQIVLQASLFDEMMKPFEGGIIVLHIKSVEGQEDDYMMKDVGNGNYEKAISFLSPGTYSVWAEVQFPERIKKRPEMTFHIEPQAIENLNTEPNHLLLENISKISGGRAITPDEDVFRDIVFKQVIIHSKKKIHFGTSIIIFLFISSLFLLELFFRKLRGLK